MHHDQRVLYPVSVGQDYVEPSSRLEHKVTAMQRLSMQVPQCSKMVTDNTRAYMSLCCGIVFTMRMRTFSIAMCLNIVAPRERLKFVL